MRGKSLFLRGSPFVFILGMLILCSTTAFGATIYVPADYPTIQAGIDAATDGDTVLVADGTYVEKIDFLGKAITVRSKNGAAYTAIVGNAAGSVVRFRNGESAGSVLEGFTVTNGSVYSGYGGGISCEGSSPTITSCTISGNTAQWGGGISCEESSSPTITNCTITGNTATLDGGGISCANSSPTITNCMITGNTATWADGGGISCSGSSPSSPTITNCMISGNSATWGGGIGCDESSSPTITNCTISGNTATDEGGGITWGDSSSPTITSCTISGNTAESGGGISGEDSSPTITNSMITGNTATDEGGGIYGVGCSPKVTNCTISGNKANNAGGGIFFNLSSAPIFINCILWEDSPNEISLVASSIFIVYSNIQSGWPGTGNIDADPLFVGGGDYHLTGSSPCIDAGTDAGVYKDIDGDARPLGAGYDMGADESVSTNLQIITRPFLPIKIGEFFSQQLETVGGVPPFSWSLISGALPAGMNLSADGVLSGTPTELGESTFTIRVADSNGGVAEKAFTVSVVFVLPPPEIRIHKMGSTAVPGRVLDHFIFVENTGEVTATNIPVTEWLDPSLHTILSADPPMEIDLPTANELAHVHWSIAELPPGEMVLLQYTSQLSGSTSLGTQVGGVLCLLDLELDIIRSCFLELGGSVLTCACFPAMCMTEMPDKRLCLGCIIACGAFAMPGYFKCLKEKADGRIEEAEACWEQDLPATGPLDPNEKMVIAKKFIQPDQRLVYPIHFENIGDVEALDVFVTDVLDSKLDVSTLEILTPDGASFDPATRTLKWELIGRNLQPGETGNVLLSIKPNPGLPSGTEIGNSAEIQFEIFEPLVTPEVVNIIDTTPPSGVMDPLPTETSTSEIPISWTGTDAIGEINFFSIFVSVDDGIFTPFLERTSETSATFTGEPGKTYGFICIAADTAGNVEVQDTVAETVTRVVIPPAVPSDLNNDGVLNQADINLFISLFGTTVDPAGTPPDYDGDGMVGLADYSIFCSYF